MARTQITVTPLTRPGVAPAAGQNADMANGMYFEDDGRTWLEIVSTDASSQTVTVAIPKLVDGQAVAGKTVVVPAGATRKAGGWPKSTYDQGDGTVNVDFTIGGATLKVSAYSLPPN